MSEYIAVLPVPCHIKQPNGKPIIFEWAGKIDDTQRGCPTPSDYSQLARQLITAAGLVTPRHNPQTVSIKILLICSKDGKLERRHVHTIEESVPLAPMTNTEYDDARRETLEAIPIQFHNFVIYQAEEYTSGYEGNLERISELVAGLKESLDAYLDEVVRSDGAVKKKKS